MKDRGGRRRKHLIALCGEAVLEDLWICPTVDYRMKERMKLTTLSFAEVQRP